jgi:peptidoglycan/xylan/chitin deacetylase (PgdA/CDA1 family)
VAISFDDGWRDNADHALPALERRGFPATVFLVADRVGTLGAFWPDEACRRMAALDPDARLAVVRAMQLRPGSDPTQDVLAALKRLPESERDEALEPLRSAAPDPAAGERELLDWSEVERMARAGIDFESHGMTHAILTALDAEKAAWELREARERLRERGHGRHALLAYPSGQWDDGTVALARDAGYLGAVTTRRAVARSDSSPLALPRLGLHEDVSASRAEFLRLVPGSGLPG